MPDPTYGGPGIADSPSWAGRGRRAGEGAEARAQAWRRGPARRGEEAGAVFPDGGAGTTEDRAGERSGFLPPGPPRPSRAPNVAPAGCTWAGNSRPASESARRRRPPADPAPSSRHVRTHVHAMRSAAGSPRVGGTPCGRGPLALPSIPLPLRAFDLRPPFNAQYVTGSSAGDQGFPTGEDSEAQRERATCQGTPTEGGDAKI